MIDKLIEMGRSLEKGWSCENFPGVATKVLSEFIETVPLEALEIEIDQWILKTSGLPKQVNVYNVFGEPSLTLFNNGKFAVDLYFWRKNDTVIHSHAFRGAFKVLYGKSLHEEFNIQPLVSSEKDILCSEVLNTKKEILNVGDVRTIEPGKALVHRILHLDNPTVTLCLRTVEDTGLSQWHHLSTGVSYKQSNLEKETIKRILYFQYKYRTSSIAAVRYLGELLDSLDTSSQLSLYESVFKDEIGLEEDVAGVLIDVLSARFIDSDWFSLYEEHYVNLGSHLLEYQASRGSLKVLAHAINCGYSHEESRRLLKELAEEGDLKDLCAELLTEDAVFIEDCYEEQVARVQTFLEVVRLVH